MIDFNREVDAGLSPWFGGPSAWMLQSFGPDQDSAWRATQPRMIPYDPTNGTISFGDMYRFGPSGRTS